MPLLTSWHTDEYLRIMHESSKIMLSWNGRACFIYILTSMRISPSFPSMLSSLSLYKVRCLGNMKHMLFAEKTGPVFPPSELCIQVSIWLNVMQCKRMVSSFRCTSEQTSEYLFCAMENFHWKHSVEYAWKQARKYMEKKIKIFHCFPNLTLIIFTHTHTHQPWWQISIILF